MGQHVGSGPKSLILLHLWQEHRAALQYDWMRAWGCPLDLTLMPLHAAWPMLREILRDRTSHSFAALAGWSFIPDPADKWIHAANQSQSRLRRKPPWEAADPWAPERTGRSAGAGARPHDERLRGRLKERLGITEQ